MLPVASDGWRFILPLVAAGAGCLFIPHWAGKSAGILMVILAVFCLFFFRDFERRTPLDESLIYSPADGKVVEVVFNGERGWLIRIFLSVFNVHVQRCPAAGQVNKITYKPGRFLDARHAQAHILNAQNSVVFNTSRGEIEVIQIAGLIARRIVCWAKEGQSFQQGERYGLIRFGSQVDLFIPHSAEILVRTGDNVYGGMTAVARWK